MLCADLGGKKAAFHAKPDTEPHNEPGTKPYIEPHAEPYASPSEVRRLVRKPHG